MMLLAFFSQSFETHDLFVIALLIVLEGTLSIDNALVLGLLAKRLPKAQQSKALTYGLIGAFVFRFMAIAAATFLLKWTIFKLLGGGYLLYVAIKHFFFDSKDKDDRSKIRIGPDGHPILEDDPEQELTEQRREQEIAERSPVVMHGGVPGPQPVSYEAISPRTRYAAFWPTVFVIEMTDIAFAIDSIVAAIGVVGRPPVDHPPEALHPKLWVVVLGGFIGVILMRFAAVLFIKLLDRFPKFEVAAYLLVTVIGAKLVIDWAGNYFFATEAHPHPVDFHSPASPAFWIFWVSMIACFCYGFAGRKPAGADQNATPTG
ncbi:MAG: hypothetical protein H7144_15985 [Burkholderiales bacterium]|nr:hypothetical protein [Phycisphaerae bacterium]